jgi:type II secretory pathway component PulF
MSHFAYIAKDPAGVEKKGSLEADSRKAAIRELARMRLTPVRLDERLTSASGNSASSGDWKQLFSRGQEGSPSGEKSLGRRQMLPFLRSLSELIGCGMQMGDAIRLMGKRLSDARLRSLANAMWSQLSQGKSLSGAMLEYSSVFDESSISLVEAGEATGNLSDILKRLVVDLEEKKEIKGKILTALAYPVFIVFVAIAVVLVFLFFLLPRIQSLLTSLGEKLPLSTRLLIDFSEFMLSYGIFILVALVGGAVALWAWRKTEKGRLFLDEKFLKLPLIGAFLRDSNILNLSQTLSLLLENGITTITALAMTERTINNLTIRKSFNEARAKIAEGASISGAFMATGYFVDIVIDIVTVGENTGNVVPSLKEVARYYGKKQSQQIKAFTGLISIGVLLIAFVFVGLIAFGIISSVFQLSSSLTVK